MRIIGHRTSDLAPRLGTALAVLALCVACGKKGPPLAPFPLAPAAPADVKVRRLGDRVYFTFRVPDKPSTGTGPLSVDHIEIFAMTVAPGMTVPPNRLLMQPAQTIATIAVRPPEEEEEEAPAKANAPAPAPAPDPRPALGELTTFVETLSPAALQPTVLTGKEKPPKPPKPPKEPRKGRNGAAAAPAAVATAAPPAPVGPEVLTRYYVARGVAKNGKPGAVSVRIEVPLLAAPAPPRHGPSASWDATSVTIAWNPPPSTTDEAPGVTYNVYSATAAEPDKTGAPPAPINATPLETTSFTHDGAAPDKEQCFVVRSVAPVGLPAAAVPAIESDPSEPICVTPKDTFPPAAPKSVAAVASAGVINLIWDANTEPDLAGYIVLRGEVPGGTLQPLMREPIRETRYADRTARPGVRYAYEVIAVDKAGNRSPASNRVEEAAR